MCADVSEGRGVVETQLHVEWFAETNHELTETLVGRPVHSTAQDEALEDVLHHVHLHHHLSQLPLSPTNTSTACYKHISPSFLSFLQTHPLDPTNTSHPASSQSFKHIQCMLQTHLIQLLSDLQTHTLSYKHISPSLLCPTNTMTSCYKHISSK